MELVRTPPEFLAAPYGRCCVGRRHLVFAHSPTLWGFSAWGTPDADDIRELLALCAVGLRGEAVPHRSLVDLRGLESVVPSMFGQFFDYTQSNAALLGQIILRQAQLRPPGLVGAVTLGFSQIARLPYPVRAFSDIEAALSWLEIEPALGLAVLGEIEAARNAAQSLHPIVARLRGELASSGVLNLAQAARRLGLSARSLQRSLQESGSSYRNELKTFQIERAKQLLLQSSETLSAIAAEVGYSSVQHFSTAFRRATGETPGGFRSRRA